MNRQGGFTLLELLVTLAVAAILMAVAAPGFRQLVMGTQAATQANALLSGLQHARSQAVNAPATVTICPSEDGRACQGNRWNKGWIVKTTEAPDSAQPSTRILQVAGRLSETTTLLNPSSAPARIQFLPSGAITSARRFIGLRVGEGESAQRRCITVSPAGEPRVEPIAQHGACSG